MPLKAGTRLGHYDVTALLGEGGMGQRSQEKAGAAALRPTRLIIMPATLVAVAVVVSVGLAWWEAAPAVPAPRPGTVFLEAELAAQGQSVFRREDVRPTLKNPSADGREFFFTRAVYSGGRGWRGGSWATDYPKADRQFLTIIDRLVDLDAYERENAVRLDDPNIRRFPFLYALEVGYMYMTEPEVKGLRDYLLAGGFLMIDDFWGLAEWANFEAEVKRVLPEYPIIEIPLDHPLFTTFYNIGEIVQVPNIRRAQGGPTWQRDGVTPHVRGIFDEQGRLMVMINWNTDIGDAWEWAESPYYSLRYSTYAIEITVNAIVYAMSH